MEEKDPDTVRISMLSDYDALAKFINQINDYHDNVESAGIRARHVPYWRAKPCHS